MSARRHPVTTMDLALYLSPTTDFWTEEKIKSQTEIRLLRKMSGLGTFERKNAIPLDLPQKHLPVGSHVKKTAPGGFSST